MKQLLINPRKGIDANTIIVRDLNTTLTLMDIVTRQKLSEEATDFTQTQEMD